MGQGCEIIRQLANVAFFVANASKITQRLSLDLPRWDILRMHTVSHFLTTDRHYSITRNSFSQSVLLDRATLAISHSK